VTELLVKYADPSISRDKLLEELRSDASDFIVAYHLLYDAKKNPYYAYDEASVDPIESEVQNLREGIINFQLGDEGDDDDVDALLLHVSPTKDLPGLKDRKKWILGFPTLMNPVAITQEIFRALVVCGFEWKVTGPYQLRCLTKVRGVSAKIMIQLFRVTENRFLLDIKKIDAETFLFFDICSRLRNEMRL